MAASPARCMTRATPPKPAPATRSSTRRQAPVPEAGRIRRMAAGRGLRIVLGLELALGVLPVTGFYAYLFPVGLFWTGRVVLLASQRIVNPFTVGMAGAFVAGGFGIASLWFTIVRRLLRGGAAAGEDGGRPARCGLLLGMAVALGLLYVMTTIGAEPTDYYLYGTPFVVAAHQLYLGRRHRAPSIPVAAAILVVAFSSGAPAEAADRPRVAAEWEPALGAL